MCAFYLHRSMQTEMASFYSYVTSVPH